MQSAPDGWFYYAVTLAFGGALIYVIIRYTARIDKTLETVQQAVSELKTMVMLQGQKMEIHDDDIDDLKKAVYPVNYKR